MDVDPAVLMECGASMVDLGSKLDAEAVALEGACLAQPSVGDVPAALIFGLAHYSWTQTRFEDLHASASEIVDLGDRLRHSAIRYIESDKLFEDALQEVFER